MKEDKRMKRVLAWLLIAALLPIFSAGAEMTPVVTGDMIAEDTTLVPDSEWTPPDLSNVGTDHPELLILKVAQEELGYVEVKDGKNYRSKYGEWMGTPYCEWCAEFLTWCVNQVDERWGTSLLRNMYPYYSSPSEGAPFFIQRHRFVSSNPAILFEPKNKQWWPDTGEYLKNNEYIPRPGDYMWLYIAGFSKTTTHVAIVEGTSLADDGSVTIHVIEGNMPDRVQRATYSINDIRMFGFGTPKKIIETEMRLYNSFDDVAVAKTWLKQLGYYTNSDMTIKFTSALSKAVQKFQRANKIKVNGKLDRNTWKKLKEVAAEQNLSSEVE